jgi:lysophospholipase L1-like esterase
MTLTALAAFVTVGAAQAQTKPALNPTIAVNSLGIPCPDCKDGERVPLHVGGRAYQHMRQWPGAYWEANIKGESFKLILSDNANMFGVYVDGRKVDTQTKPRYQAIQYSGFSDGPHSIRIETQTESQGGEYFGVTDVEVDNPAKSLPAPAPRARQIEFIGDSYTVGYGNTSPKQQCTRDEVWATTDTSQAFGPLTAKHYDADYQINAISGRGMVRNYGGFIADTLPEAYPYVLFDKQTKYDDPNWRPQIIVIGLGTNDFTTPLNPGEKWKTRDDLHKDYEATYVKFVQNLRAKNPQAFFILMATDQVDGEIQSEAQKVMAALQSAGEARIAFLPMNNLSFGGCDWHPTIADDRKVSDELVAFIDQHPEIWQGK